MAGAAFDARDHIWILQRSPFIERERGVYFADGYRNKRVVFDSNTGAYKRHWGGYGEEPVDVELPKYSPNETPIRSFRATHSVHP